MEYEFYPNKAAIKKKVKGSSVHQNVVVPVWIGREALLSVPASRNLKFWLSEQSWIEPICANSLIEPSLSTSMKITA